MPLAARIVEPYRLGRKPLLPEDRDEGPKAERAVIHNAVLGAMLQLASLIRHADDIFCDLSEECQKICEKTEKITRKIAHIEDLTYKLDSKKVQIPVGDLKKYTSVADHHASYYGYDCRMFTADSRPQCVRDRYNLADVTPAKALRGADAYRKDGMYSSLLFKLWPVFHNNDKVKSPDLSLPKRIQPVVSFKKDYKKLKIRDRPKTVALDDLNQEDLVNEKEEELGPNKTSSTVVIDTSGSAFHRMCSFRESLKPEFRRSKRRRTVSGVPDNIMKEIHVFDKEKRVGGRIQPRSYSFDDLDAKDEPEKDEIMAQYFDEIDAKYEELLEAETAAKEPRYMKFIPCRRTRSLPRTVKSKRSSSSETRTPISFASSLSLSRSISSMASSRLSRATKRSSILGNKIKSIVQNVSSSVSRSRPKSLDLDALEFNSETESVPSRARSTTNISSAMSLPDGILSTTSSSEQSIGPGTYYYFESSTIPKAQAKKYNFPWESLPKDWTTSVKLREISKRRPKEERHSSSGHWSASSCSNRQSVESGKSSIPSTYSAYSLGKDSGRDSPSFSDSRTGTSTYKEHSPQSSSQTESPDQFTKMDTDTWLKSLAKRAASREDVSPRGENVLNSLSKLTRQNIRALDMMSPDLKNPKLEDEFSEFSVDQDGFFTSFHNDSGLRRSNPNLADDDSDLSPIRDPSNLFHMGSNNTIDSVIFRPTSGPGHSLGPGKGTVLKRVSGKLPPPPPMRTCSMTSISLPISDSTFEIGEASPAISEGSNGSLCTSGKQRHDSSFSESDQETIYARLKLKTCISSSAAYPSWCSVSPSDSGEEIRLSPKTDADGQELNNSLTSPEDELNEIKSKCSHNHSGNTLPRTRKYLSQKNWEEESLDPASNSWPRSQKSGILKTEHSPTDSSKPSKTLNFDPVVNLVGSASKNGEVTTTSYKLAIPFMDDDDPSESSSTIPMKYQPTITVTPKGRAGELRTSSLEGRSKASRTKTQRSISTPVNHYAVSDLKGVPIRAPSEVSASSLSISSLCADEGGYMDMSGAGLLRRSKDNISNSSSLGLSDIDTSLTYVSMSSPFSTPNNSTLNLHEHEPVSKTSLSQKNTYRVSSALLAAAAVGTENETKDINSNSIKYRKQHKSAKQEISSRLSAPPLPSTPVAIVNNHHGNRPHSQAWSNHLNSSTPSSSVYRKSSKKEQDEDATSLTSNSSRSDSYRVAMRTDFNNELPPPEVTRQPQKSVARDTSSSKLNRKSTGSINSKPVNSTMIAQDPDSNVNRADSYRIAVRQTNGIVSPLEASGRNSSYRVAVKEKYDHFEGQQLFSGTSSSSLSERRGDNRRRGITDIEQLKDYAGDDHHKKFSLKSASNLFATINSSKKKMNVKSEIESLLRTNPSPESTRSSKPPKSPKSPKTDKSKNKEHRSSTYIRFDPIFEDKEDFLNSSRTNSVSSLNKNPSSASSAHYLTAEDDPLLGKTLSQPLPVNRGSRSSLSGKKVDDKAVMSILDSIKSTIKSISTKNGEGEGRLATDV